jgi:hypothetical protein
VEVKVKNPWWNSSDRRDVASTPAPDWSERTERTGAWDHLALAARRRTKTNIIENKTVPHESKCKIPYIYSRINKRMNRKSVAQNTIRLKIFIVAISFSCQLFTVITTVTTAGEENCWQD